MFQRKIEKNDRVDVKFLNGTREPTWKQGKIDRLAGRGAYVRLDDGTTNFFWLSQIRHVDGEATLSKPFAKLGEVAPLSELLEKPAFKEVEKPAAPKPDNVATLGSEKPAEESSKSDLDGNANVFLSWKPSATRVGDEMRRARVEKKVSQYQLAARIGVRQDEVSRYEIGRSLPSDDVLEKACTLLGLDLAKMIDVRTQDRDRLERERAKRGSAPRRSSKKTEPAIEKKHAEAGSKIEEPIAEAASEERASFEEFLEDVVGICPIPADKETRALWFQATRTLHDLLKV